MTSSASSQKRLKTKPHIMKRGGHWMLDWSGWARESRELRDLYRAADAFTQYLNEK